MRAVVVYESLWGNTAAVAGAIAEGIGPEARTLSTAQATAAEIEGAGLIVAGGPVLAFHLSAERMRESIRERPEPGAPPADLTHPSLRSWLDTLAAGQAWFGAFDTQVRGPFGKGAPTIAKALAAKGYRQAADPEGFVVGGKYGPLLPGELDRARRWGAKLARVAAGGG